METSCSAKRAPRAPPPLTTAAPTFWLDSAVEKVPVVALLPRLPGELRLVPVVETRLIFFANPTGLKARTGNAFVQTDVSGEILLQQANTGGTGSVSASALESSTVDLAEEITKLITTQHAYSASAKIITTADEMLEELIRIRP